MLEAIGFLGLGALGLPIAENLLASGASLTVWNRTLEKADGIVAKGARRADTAAGAVTKGGVVFTILWDDASLEETVTDAFLDALGGGVHVSMTTVTPETSRMIAQRHAERGSAFVEAPIFGVPPQAVARTLVVCLAGATAAKERVKPLLEAMGAAKVFDLGEEIGAGTATKLAGNYLIISGFGLLQEAFDVLKASGIDPKPTLDMLTATVFATPSAQRFVGHLTSGNPLPMSGIPAKDIALFQRFAAAGQTPTPIAKQIEASLRR